MGACASRIRVRRATDHDSGIREAVITPVHYISTRGQAPVLSFDDVVLTGLANDGGLYVPETWPVFQAESFAEMARLDYPAIAARVMAAFASPTIDESELAKLCADAYREFDHPDIAPLIQLEDGLWLYELFHGPTLAFKDYAMQVLGRLFDLVLKRRGERVTIVGATSGDTGSAAIEACRDRDAIEIFILHPKGRVSEVQRRQMTTATSANVHNIAIEGTFDDCQDLVKAMFNDPDFRNRHNLSAINSINWARIAAQVVYYAFAALKFGGPGQPVAFAVPTGNFGNVFAAYVAKCCGLPIGQLAIGSNQNDILTRFFETGTMKIGPVFATLSPSMDIQISSNFERYLFELWNRSGSAVAEIMKLFRLNGSFTADPARLARARETFLSSRLDDNDTKAVIRGVFETTGRLIDPHSAIGLAAARTARGKTGDMPMVAVATAHPAKFADAVEDATGVRPELPERLADLLERPERVTALPSDLATVKRFIETARMDNEVQA